MINEFQKGMARGLGILLVVGGGLFAFLVTGTIKTWTTGETLTASDINTTVQSLKTALENASQLGSTALHIQQPQGATFNTNFLGLGPSATDESTMVMLRSGTVKNAVLKVPSATNTTGVTCTITLRKNLADTLIQFTIPSASTADVTDADTVNYASGDRLSWRASCPGNGGYMLTNVSFEF